MQVCQTRGPYSKYCDPSRIEELIEIRACVLVFLSYNFFVYSSKKEKFNNATTILFSLTNENKYLSRFRYSSWFCVKT